ncbi:hypothetical protein ACUL41_06975 [Virgibacillus natechei]
MKAVNQDGKIIAEFSYDEIAKITNVLNKHWLTKEDEEIQLMAYDLSNPKIVK